MKRVHLTLLVVVFLLTAIFSTVSAAGECPSQNDETLGCYISGSIYGNHEEDNVPGPSDCVDARSMGEIVDPRGERRGDPQFANGNTTRQQQRHCNN